MGRRGCWNVGVWRLLYLYAFLFFVLIVNSVNAQGVYEAWVARYDGTASSNDGPYGITIDDSGNVYITGWTTGSGSGTDYLTIKYMPTGDTAWARTYNGPGNADDTAFAITLDAARNVYVTGSSGGIGTAVDYATIKYDSDGVPVWVKRYNGPGNGWDVAWAIVTDDSGNSYVTGYSQGGTSSSDIATIKYKPNGDSMWVARYNGAANGADMAGFFGALAVDDSHNVYVTGSSTVTGSDFDYLTIKYDASGGLVWQAHGGSADSTDYGLALAVDDIGNIYMTGASFKTQTVLDYVTIKYLPSGDTVWVRTYDGPGHSGDGGLRIKVDGNRNVYVTGQSFGDTTNYDYATIKYYPNGDTAWVRRYNNDGVNSGDNAFGLDVDDSGNVYVTGFSGGGETGWDYATVKYQASGDVGWVMRYDGPDRGDDRGINIEADNTGNVLVAGKSWSTEGNFDWAVVKYAPCSAIPGDANASSTLTIGDIIHLVNYIFDKDKLPCLGIDPGNCWTPDPFCRGDVNQTGTITIGDIVHLVNYVFDKDKLPCLGSDPGNCWTPEANGACCLAVP